MQILAGRQRSPIAMLTGIFAFTCSQKKPFEPAVLPSFRKSMLLYQRPHHRNTLIGLRTVSQLCLFGRKPRFTSYALFEQKQSDATFGRKLSKQRSEDPCCCGTRLFICPMQTASDIQRFPKLLGSPVLISSCWSVVFVFSFSQKKRFEPCCSAKFPKIHAAVPEATPSHRNTLTEQLYLVSPETPFHEFYIFLPNAI